MSYAVSPQALTVERDRMRQGWLNGFLGMVIFAGSLPATRLAVADFSPTFLTCARATIAGGLGLALLIGFRERRPARSDLRAFFLVALGVVVGYPLLSALALQHISSARSIVVLGLLPLATAVFGVMRGAARPRPAFWLFSGAGSACIAGFAASGGGLASWRGDGLMLAAIALCAVGYAEGARLTGRFGGWQVISWALVLSLPVMVPLMLLTAPPSLAGVTASAWWGLAYVSLFSMLLGFVFWYRGLALGGIAAVSQLQLLQPFLALTLAALLLHETIEPRMLVASLGAMLCVAGAKRYAK